MSSVVAAGRECEEQAFWASAALELLGKAASVRISPMLIAHPGDDGRSILIASGAVDYAGSFGTIRAKAVWSRCARAFRTFNEVEAKKIAAGRNEYIHSTGVGFDSIPQAQWWLHYRAQAFILIEHLDQTIPDFVGSVRSEQDEAHLAANKQYRERRDCPACASSGEVSGDEVVDSHVEYPTFYDSDPEDPFDDPRSITLDITPYEFRCPVCHLVLDEPEYENE